ncbi:MAG: TIGR03013 family XrtA/PEP-CTERM system glycosyltransferase [Burkholderiales bacterium]
MIRLFNHYFHKRALYLICFEMGLLVFLVTAAFLYQSADPFAVKPMVLMGALWMATGVSTINTGLGFYHGSHSLTTTQVRLRAIVSLCLSLPLAYVVYRISPLPPEDAMTFLLSLITALGLMLVYRAYTAVAYPWRAVGPRVLVYGTGTNARLVGSLLLQSEPHANLVGYYASPSEPGAQTALASGWQPQGCSLTEVAEREHVTEIVVALHDRRNGSMPLRELLDCKLNGIKVVDSATHLEKSMGQIRRDAVSAGWLIFGTGFEQGPLRRLIKRIVDIVFSCLLIVLTLPLMLLTGLLILLEDARPVLYRQERVGLHGRLFNVVKFRSMRTDAEKDGTPRWASASDDRITRVGRIIRKLRIDELPQLFCVLRGDMSLVGPRPERAYFVSQLTRELPYYAVRHSVKPGVTGWAQVRYHYGASVDDSAEKLQYDLYYVKNHSLLLDLLVLFETVGVVLTGKGAQ